ncbi:uncharacterized protein FOMMEDRAFT_149831 [Fomitiporia mediterranea MF3/22]|uniref:uncharacterized protein n=1 Tax=Fomitiporia mediterranea (strain MF3/22) TaxID=694068 RepID=UPI0004409203|nr:uncharacterized protein FOMMEDRAFT_149831 [Fomitiporia mediterranea MF3/22]EJD07315.1 hypothetical protein FOMMEDRAFT_149831 [Fomitiporia mediterranea MF3/22]
MDLSDLPGAAASSVPHAGPILAVMIAIGTQVYNEYKALDAKFEVQKGLYENATHTLGLIALLRKNLTAHNSLVSKRLTGLLNQAERIANEIQIHVAEVSQARERHIRKYGTFPANLYEAVVEPSKVHGLRKQLDEAKHQLAMDLALLSHCKGVGVESKLPPPYSEGSEEDLGKAEIKAFEPVWWVNGKEFLGNPEKCKDLVPLGSKEETEGNVLWYIARIPHIHGIQPGKFSPERGAYFGYKMEALPAEGFNYEVLVAEPGAVDWERTSGKFSKGNIRRAPVKGCCENRGTELVIARAWAREHMRTGIFKEKYLQVGKASPRLEGAYVTAGRKEKQVNEYEVLVYA